MITTIIIHCSATPPDMDIGAEEIREWHKGRGWSDIGYHYVVRRGGAIEKGRDDNVQGAHTKGHNKGSLGVCLIGGVDKDNSPDSNFSRNQWKALSNLVDDLIEEYGPLKVIGHRDVSSKSCPCFDVGEWYA